MESEWKDERVAGILNLEHMCDGLAFGSVNLAWGVDLKTFVHNPEDVALKLRKLAPLVMQCITERLELLRKSETEDAFAQGEKTLVAQYKELMSASLNNLEN